MKNLDIRQYATKNRIALWEISEELGYTDQSSFSRILRHELAAEKKEEIKRIIDKLASQPRED